MGEIQIVRCMMCMTKRLRPSGINEDKSRYRRYQPEGNLGNNFHDISSAIESIWVPNLNIINDYTDHGKAHSERVLNWAVSLLPILKDKTGADLSDVERYLLLTSGFLHDIGMQCDIIKFPHIKREAEKLHADFTGVEFKAASSSTYSIDEQKSIRKNHHLLTAAWIQCAFANRGDDPATGLDDVARLINPSLVQSLKDICMYHSTLPVDTHFKDCLFDKDARIQLIAALLRLADELDIGRPRVPTRVHKNFRLDPENGKYWWIHERTNIYLDYVCEENYGQEKIIEGKITFHLTLHPDDITRLRIPLQKNVIDEFKNKCEGLLEILRSFDIPLSIEANLISNTNEEKMPMEISENFAMDETCSM